MDLLKALAGSRSVDQDVGQARMQAEQTAAQAFSASPGLLRAPPPAARSFADDTSHDGACTPALDVEAQLGKSSSSTDHICRICLSEDITDELIQPCNCVGSIGYIHTACLAAWVQEKGSLTCELCQQQYKEPYMQALEVCVQCSQQHHETAHVDEGAEARQAVGINSCRDWLLHAPIGQWICLLIITAALVSFAVLAGGVGVGMARFRETPDPAAPRGLSSAQASTPDAGHAQSALMEGNAVAGARYGTMP